MEEQYIEGQENDGVGETGEAIENPVEDSNDSEYNNSDNESSGGEVSDNNESGQIIELLQQLVANSTETPEESEQQETVDNIEKESVEEEPQEEQQAEVFDYSAYFESILINQELILEKLENNAQDQITENQYNTERLILENQSNMEQVVTGLGMLTIAIGFVVGLLVIRLLFGRIMNGGENG